MTMVSWKVKRLETFNNDAAMVDWGVTKEYISISVIEGTAPSIVLQRYIFFGCDSMCKLYSWASTLIEKKSAKI